MQPTKEWPTSLTSSTETSDLFAAIGSVQQELPALAKDAENPYYHSSYVSLNATMRELKPLLKKHNLVVTQFPFGKKELFLVISHTPSKQWISCSSGLEVKEENNPQMHGSSITYMRRYQLKSVFLMEDEDDDGNVATAQKAEPTKASPPAKQGTGSSQWPPKPLGRPTLGDVLGDLHNAKTVAELDAAMQKYEGFMTNDATPELSRDRANKKYDEQLALLKGKQRPAPPKQEVKREEPEQPPPPDDDLPF